MKERVKREECFLDISWNCEGSIFIPEIEYIHLLEDVFKILQDFSIFFVNQMIYPILTAKKSESKTALITSTRIYFTHITSMH